jgi:hypothetical protein
MSIVYGSGFQTVVYYTVDVFGNNRSDSGMFFALEKPKYPPKIKIMRKRLVR